MGGNASTFIDQPGLKLLTCRDLSTASWLVFTTNRPSGTHLPIGHSKTPLDYFLLFLDDDIDEICQNTNT